MTLSYTYRPVRWPSRFWWLNWLQGRLHLQAKHDVTVEVGFPIVPGSLDEASRIQRKLLELELRRMRQR